MALFYHIDRVGKLTEKAIIGLTKFNDIQPIVLQEHVNSLFPEGVSQHGDTYFISNNGNMININTEIELIFEYVRRSNFPKMLSRFQAFYAFDNIYDANEFRVTYCNSKGSIFEVEAEYFEKHDMGMLMLNGSILSISYYAHLYWKGESNSEKPKWENLLKPPIRISKRVIA